MNLITKLGLGILSLGVVTNISGRVLSNYYNNQKNNSIAVLESTFIKTKPTKAELDNLINKFEKDFLKYGKKIDYTNLVKEISYAAIPLGGALVFGKRKIVIDINMA